MVGEKITSMQSSKETLSRRLKELMAKRPDLGSQVKLSRRTGLAQSTVGRLLNKVNAADIDVVDMLAGAFGVTASDLLNSSPRDVHLLSLIQQINEKETKEVIQFIEFMILKRQNVNTGMDFEHESALSRQSAASVSRASALDIDHDLEQSHERNRKRN